MRAPVICLIAEVIEVEVAGSKSSIKCLSTIVLYHSLSPPQYIYGCPCAQIFVSHSF